MSAIDHTNDKLGRRRVRRQAFIGRLIAELGEGWAKRFRDELDKEGRPAEGGWPGTLGEARSCIDTSVLPALLRANMQAPTTVERIALARALYISAKTHWRSFCE